MVTNPNPQRPIGLFLLSLVAILVGVVTGFGAIAFRGLIGLIHNLFFLGRFSFFYDANAFTPASPWGIFVILVPVVGALIVTLLVTKFAPEARGHGVPSMTALTRSWALSAQLCSLCWPKRGTFAPPGPVAPSAGQATNALTTLRSTARRSKVNSIGPVSTSRHGDGNLTGQA